jgi:nucleoside-diphosphate-sugar epimerase
MDGERFLVTGALGCIGAWVVRNLVREGTKTVVFDLGKNSHRLQLVMDAEQIDKIQFIQGDITDLASVEKVISDFGVTNIVHLAALQLPFCKADPPRGAAVNVLGTVNIFEAARRAGLKRVVYASSTAVYGLSEEYPEGKLEHDAPLKPRSHYGVYKQANEGTARVYWLENGFSSIGLRPYVVYGAGRDQGMTSTPTMAMLAAAAGQPYKISYGGRYCFQYADDVARAFIRATRAPFEGAEVYNIGGNSVSTSEIIAAIENVAPEMRGKISFDDIPLPFPEEVDNTPLANILGSLKETPLSEGTSETIGLFKQAIRQGLLKVENV